MEMLLKSDHFGIEISESTGSSFKVFGLKSDHFGIEIDATYKVCSVLTGLKSDHFGIEITNYQDNTIV